MIDYLRENPWVIVIFILLVLRISLQLLRMKSRTKKVPVNPQVSMWSSDNEIMNTPIRKARFSYQKFLDAFQTAGNKSSFSVKLAYPISDNGGNEHIWVEDLRMEGKTLKGNLGNEPEYIPNLKLGDEVTVNASNISDWRFVSDGVVYGGFAIYPFLPSLTSEQKKGIENALGGRFSEQPRIPGE